MEVIWNLQINAVNISLAEEMSVVSEVKTQEVEQESPSHSSDETSDIPQPTSPGLDSDLARMETLLDNWCLDLKRNVLV